jgi:hypothetical protein
MCVCSGWNLNSVVYHKIIKIAAARSLACLNSFYAPTHYLLIVSIVWKLLFFVHLEQKS